MAESPKIRITVITGANKGIRLETCKQLASVGVLVVLTSREEKRGNEAVQKLEDSGLSGSVVYHQLNVTDSDSVSTLANFIRFIIKDADAFKDAGIGMEGVEIDWSRIISQPYESAEACVETIYYGARKMVKAHLDLLLLGGSPRIVNVSSAARKLEATGVLHDAEKVDTDRVRGDMHVVVEINWGELVSQPYELAVSCLDTDYYGAKRMIEAHIDLLRRSSSPRIVNVSSSGGKLERVPNMWAKTVLGNVDSLVEKKIDVVIDAFLRDFKDGLSVAKGRPVGISAYVISKAAMIAYTRILAKKHPEVYINSACPGFVRTDMTLHMGVLYVEEGAESVVKLALQPDGGLSGRFLVRTQEFAF